MKFLDVLNKAIEFNTQRFITFSEGVDRRNKAGEFGKWPWQKDYGLWPWQRRRRSPSDR